jgi:alpha-beta hydrolase superfamily lysophospholipase
VRKATSADGTTIAYDQWGDGPLVVIVGGAFNDRGTWAELAQALAGDFTVVSYDRRGRGESGDTEPYAVQREIEDLTAVITDRDPDRTAYAHGISSGGALLLRAIAAGAPVTKVSILEPPYRVPGAPPAPPDYRGTLRRFIASGDRGAAVEYFMTGAVGLAPEAVAGMKATPAWAYLEAMAHTLVYDAEALGGDDQQLPTELLAGIAIPLLTVSSAGTAPWLASAAEAVAQGVPSGRYASLEGDFHQVPPAVLAPALATFYGIPSSTT